MKKKKRRETRCIFLEIILQNYCCFLSGHQAIFIRLHKLVGELYPSIVTLKFRDAANSRQF